MSQPSITTSSVPDTAGRVARYGRLALLWAVVAIACVVAYRLGGVWADWRHVAEQHPTQQSSAAGANAMAAAMLPLAGQWSFDDLDWTIQSNLLTHDDVVARIDAFAHSNGGPTAEQLPDVDPKFLKLASDLHIAPIERFGNQLYTFDRPDAVAQMVTRTVAGRAKVVSIAAAVRQPDDQWKFYNLAPRQAAGKTSEQVAHLLPLPPEARRSAGRFGERGELLLEMVELDSNANRLLDIWRQAGWDVHATGLGDDEAFSYLCVRGADTIYVWSANASDSLHSLMLVRNPSPGDTGAGS